MKRQWLEQFIPAGIFVLAGVFPSGCEERAENSPKEQARPVKSEPVQAVDMNPSAKSAPPAKIDFWGRPIDPVATAVKKNEPNFWDVSTWRLDFWNAPPSPDPATMATNNKSLDKLIELNRRQQDYGNKYGTTPPPQNNGAEKPNPPPAPAPMASPNGG